MTTATAALPEYVLRAAVLSVFDVPWVAPVIADDDVDELAEFLTSSCERVVDEEGIPHWRLRDGVRAQLFRRIPRDALRNALARLTDRPDDCVQVTLGRYLEGALPPVDRMGAAELAGVLHLQRWFGAESRLPSRAEVTARIDRLAIMRPLEQLIARGFVGRRDVLSALADFAAGAPERPHTAPVFAIEGPGGAGKSTVVSRFILERLDQGAPAIYLNYDRGWLIDGGPWALLDEVLRQVSVQRPRLAEAMTHLRRQVAARKGSRVSYAEVSSRGSQRYESIPTSLLVPLANVVARGEAFVVVIDTTEELARRDFGYSYELADFLDLLHEAMPELRVILAGRTTPRAGFEGMRLWRLDDLEHTDALQLLRSLTSGEDEEILAEIISMVGRNPLNLQLAADVLRRTGRNPTRMLAVGEGNVQGQLYARLLDHISDPKVRAVAHPGLVVRRLTPRIIRDVLAEPCGIAPLDDAESLKIFYGLQREATLCTDSPDGDGALVHRQDVRGLMLPAIRRDLPGITRSIHFAAVGYYTNLTPDAHDYGVATSPEVARREELYHRLMLDESADLNDRWQQAAGTELATVIDELPLRSQLYLATKVPGLRLGADVRAEADDDGWRAAVRPRVMLLFERGREHDALDLLRERRGRRGEPLLPDLEVEALERLGRLEEALNLATTETERASRAGAEGLVRELIVEQSRVLERMKRWLEAGTLLEGLAEIYRNRRARRPHLDEEVRIRELVILSSLLRIVRHQNRADHYTRTLMDETVELAEATPARLLSGRPSLLRDLAAEIGRASPQILALAVAELGGVVAGREREKRADEVLEKAGRPAGTDSDADDSSSSADRAAVPDPFDPHELIRVEREAEDWMGVFTADSDESQGYA
jgi:hypothetical protein